MERNGATHEERLQALGGRARAGLPLFGAEGAGGPAEDTGPDEPPPEAAPGTAPPRQPSHGLARGGEHERNGVAKHPGGSHRPRATPPALPPAEDLAGLARALLALAGGRLTVCLPELGLTVTLTPAAEAPPPPAPLAGPAPPGVARHSEDFRTASWFGSDYTFTPTQAAVIRQLWEAWEDGTPGLGQETLLERAGSAGSRVRDVFRGSPAWGLMLGALGKGLFAIAPPETFVTPRKLPQRPRAAPGG